MICSKCGRICSTNESFCAQCGNNLQNIQTSHYNTGTINNNMLGQQTNNNVVNQATNNYSNLNSEQVNYYSNNNINNQSINYYQNSNIQDNSKKNNTVIYVCCAIILVTLIIVVGLIAKSGSDKVYFNKEDNEITYTDEEIVETSNRNKYETIIDPNNQYYKIVSTVDQANQEIKSDSVNQKSTCSKEIIEIENRIINNYGITAVNLCELDVDYAKEIEQVIKHVYEEFPSARGYLTNFSLINAPMSEGYVACFNPYFPFIQPDNGSYPTVVKTRILLNTTYFLNIDYMVSSMKNASTSGHFPPNTTRSSSVAHEFAHYFSYITILKKYNAESLLLLEETEASTFYKVAQDFSSGSNSLDIIKEAYKNYQTKYNDYTTSLDNFRASISGYAVAKDNEGNYIYDETIAEAYHDWYLNGDNAKPASKEVVAVLKDRLG